MKRVEIKIWKLEIEACLMIGICNFGFACPAVSFALLLGVCNFGNWNLDIVCCLVPGAWDLIEN